MEDLNKIKRDLASTEDKIPALKREKDRADQKLQEALDKKAELAAKEASLSQEEIDNQKKAA